MGRIVCLAFVFLVASMTACTSPSEQREQIRTVDAQVWPPLPEAPPTVMVDMNPASPAPDSGGFQIYDCTYTAAGKTAKFRLKWRQTGALSGEIPMARAEGSFLAVEGSDNSVLLADLRKVLEAKTIPKKASRAAELQFDAVVFGGGHENRDASTDWRDKSSADWTLLKVFLPKGGGQGEMFLYVNSVAGKAEFSIKDSRYGDYLMGQLARVL